MSGNLTGSRQKPHVKLLSEIRTFTVVQIPSKNTKCKNLGGILFIPPYKCRHNCDNWKMVIFCGCFSRVSSCCNTLSMRSLGQFSFLCSHFLFSHLNVDSLVSARSFFVWRDRQHRSYSHDACKNGISF